MKATIFIDESGTLPDLNDQVIVIAAVSTKQKEKLESIFKYVHNTGTGAGTHPRLEDQLPLFMHQCRENNQNQNQPQNSKNQIYQKSISHLIHLLNQRLTIHNTNDITDPNNTATILDLSRTAGNTTEAIATKAKSENMSDNFSSWEVLNLGRLIKGSIPRRRYQ